MALSVSRLKENRNCSKPARPPRPILAAGSEQPRVRQALRKHLVGTGDDDGVRELERQQLYSHWLALLSRCKILKIGRVQHGLRSQQEITILFGKCKIVFWLCNGLWQTDPIGILDRAICDAAAWCLSPYLLISWPPLSGPLLQSE